MIWKDYKAKIQEIHLPELSEKTLKLSVLREDLVHTDISGNKYRKLKYNIIEAKKLGFKKILTFGGAFSNHIAATAVAGKIHNFQTIGIIRGEELKNKIKENPTLRYAESCGMRLLFISREVYRKKENVYFLEELKEKVSDAYIIPEGGTNDLAIEGCKEILYDECFDYDYIGTSVGTCGTITGLIESAKSNQTIIGFPSLKGSFIENNIRSLTHKKNFIIFNDYHFGGYGKVSDKLISFINAFKQLNDIQLDPVYTGKMFFGISDLIKKKYFHNNASILLVHTGGLQGIGGMNNFLIKKKRNIIR